MADPEVNTTPKSEQTCDLEAANMPGVSPERARAICEVRDAIARGTGDSSLNSRWDWSHAKPAFENDSFRHDDNTVLVPGTKKRIDLVIANTRAELEALCDVPGIMGCNAEKGWAVVVPTPTATNVDLTLLEKTFAGYTKVLRPVSPETRDTWYKSLVEHEAAHADLQVSEFTAWRKQADYLAKQGMIEPMSNDQVMTLCPSVSPNGNSFAKSVMERFDGNLTSAAREWFPDGEKLIQTYRNNLHTLRNNPEAFAGIPEAARRQAIAQCQEWIVHPQNAPLALHFRNGIEEYFQSKFLTDFKSKHHLSDPELLSQLRQWDTMQSRGLDTPIKRYMDQKLGEFDKLAATKTDKSS